MKLEFYTSLKNPQVTSVEEVPLLIIKDGEYIIGVAFEEQAGAARKLTVAHAGEPTFASILKRYNIHGKTLQITQLNK